MSHPLKLLINGMLRSFGFEIHKVRETADPFLVQSRLIKKQNPVIFDVGANVGDVSAIYQGLFPSCEIHAFEPFSKSFDKLKERFKHSPAIQLNEVAVSDTEGIVSLSANSSSATNSILKTDPASSQFWGKGVLDTAAFVQVSTTTIDAYCKTNAITTIDILKLDIQGAELKALRGTQNMLKNGSVKLIYMEMIFAPTYLAQPDLEEYFSFFRQSGYIMLDIFNPTRNGLRLIQSDIIFVRNPNL